MIDVRGKQLRPGDLVVIGRAPSKLVYGKLVRDPDDIRWVRFAVETEDGKVIYIDKDENRILNMTAYFHEEVNKPFVLTSEY